MKLSVATLLAALSFGGGVSAFVGQTAPILRSSHNNKASSVALRQSTRNTTTNGAAADSLSSSAPKTRTYEERSRDNNRQGPYLSPQEARTRALERTGNQVRSGRSLTGIVESVYDVWDNMRKTPTTVQGGGSLRTWSFVTCDRAQVVLRTEGRPLDASVELWAGPNHTPQSLYVYSEDGERYPFAAAIATPYGYTSTIAIRNVAQLEFPLEAGVEADNREYGLGALTEPVRQSRGRRPRIIQGNSVNTFPIDPMVGRMQVFLESDGRPLNARIELLEGPNSIKQVIELYGEDGMKRPFLAVLETPGPGSVIRIVNTGTVEFPIYAHVEPLGRHRGRDGSFYGGGGGRDGYYDNGYDRSSSRGGGYYDNGYDRNSSRGGGYYSDRDGYRSGSGGDRGGYGYSDYSGPRFNRFGGSSSPGSYNRYGYGDNDRGSNGYYGGGYSYQDRVAGGYGGGSSGYYGGGRGRESGLESNWYDRGSQSNPMQWNG